MDYKNLLGILGVIIGIIGYAPYIRDIYRNKTKPHLFSWLMWGIIESIILAVQINQKAGPGAYVTGFTAWVCFVIAYWAYRKGLRDFVKVDWILLASSATAILLWYFTKNPLGSVILLIVTDAAAFAITFRKTFFQPHTETLFEYSFAALKSLIGIFALQNYNINNWLFFAYLIIGNTAFVIMVQIRRRNNPEQHSSSD